MKIDMYDNKGKSSIGPAGTSNKIKLAIPKGKLYKEVAKLLSDAGFGLSTNGRCYRPRISDDEIEVKVLKPQNIPKLVELGSQDIAFTGYDWVAEQRADVVELMDLGFNPVRLVAAVQKDFDILLKGKIRVASEYESISKEFLQDNGMDFVFIKSFGATEVFVPEDADMIIDNSSTGQTLEENNLMIFREVLRSSTRLIANKAALQEPWKSRKISDILTIIKSVIEARKRFFIEMNVPEDKMEAIVPLLPCMKSPTISKLYGDQGFAVKIAVEKDKVTKLIPFLKEQGARDIIVFDIRKVIQ